MKVIIVCPGDPEMDIPIAKFSIEGLEFDDEEHCAEFLEAVAEFFDEMVTGAPCYAVASEDKE